MAARLINAMTLRGMKGSSRLMGRCVDARHGAGASLPRAARHADRQRIHRAALTRNAYLSAHHDSSTGSSALRWCHPRCHACAIGDMSRNWCRDSHRRDRQFPVSHLVVLQACRHLSTGAGDSTMLQDPVHRAACSFLSGASARRSDRVSTRSRFSSPVRSRTQPRDTPSRDANMRFRLHPPSV